LGFSLFRPISPKDIFEDPYFLYFCRFESATMAITHPFTKMTAHKKECEVPHRRRKKHPQKLKLPIQSNPVLQ